MVGLIVAIGLPIAMRLLDMFLPKGHHLKIVARYAVPDDHDAEEATDETQ